MTDDGVAAFIETFALALTRAGMQRMAARVFAALITTDSGDLTARETAELLDVSPAAVSGALAYLTQSGAVTRGRRPGERVDHYAIGDAAWYETMGTKAHTLADFAEILAQGVAAVPTGSPAHDRLLETQDFFVFIAAELPLLVDRWRATRAD